MGKDTWERVHGSVRQMPTNYYHEFIKGNFTMLTAIKTEEAGFRSAMLGLAKSKKQPLKNMPALAEKLAPLDGGHNKFLEAMIIWVDVRAPRYWWQEGDTFRLSTKQSESTMHTLVKEIIVFDIDADNTQQRDLFIRQNFEIGSICMEQFNQLIIHAKDDDIEKLKANLPEGFLQSRLWCFSYKTFRNMILQRRTHRLPHWPVFLKSLLAQVDHPEMLPVMEVRSHG